MEKTYTLPDGTKFIFEYDHNRMGIITLECMDTLMSLLKATAEQTEPQSMVIPRKGCHRPIELACHTEQGDGYCKNCVYWHEDFEGIAYGKVEDEPQTESLEQFRVGLEYHTDTTHFGKVKGENITTNKVKTEPQEGKWIAKTENNHSHWVCSECGAWALLDYNEQQCLSNSCPDCGARMKGADDDQILLR